MLDLAEQLHTPIDVPGWQESYYFGFQTDDIAAAFRLGLRPGAGADHMALILLPDRTLSLIHRGPAAFDFAALEQGPFAFHLETPLRRWRLAGQAEYALIPPGQETLAAIAGGAPAVPVTLDLCFKALAPAYTYPHQALDFMGPQQTHYEQGGRVTGTLLVDGRPIPVAGLGIRDHSWGVRDWLRPVEWYWLNLAAADGAFLCAATLGRSLDGVASGGFVWQEERLWPVQRLDIEAGFGPGLALDSGRVRLATERGEIVVAIAGRRSAHTRLLQTKDGQVVVSGTLLACDLDGRPCQGWLEHGRREPTSTGTSGEDAAHD